MWLKALKRYHMIFYCTNFPFTVSFLNPAIFLNHICLNVYNRLRVMYVFLKNFQLRLVYLKDLFLGSVLGSILFLIYINDLPLIFANCKCHLYADDTTLYCCARTKLEAERRLQENI